jgi:hypothetical protein
MQKIEALKKTGSDAGQLNVAESIIGAVFASWRLFRDGAVRAPPLRCATRATARSRVWSRRFCWRFCGRAFDGWFALWASRAISTVRRGGGHQCNVSGCGSGFMVRER